MRGLLEDGKQPKHTHSPDGHWGTLLHCHLPSATQHMNYVSALSQVQYLTPKAISSRCGHAADDCCINCLQPRSASKIFLAAVRWVFWDVGGP